jgi:hypothetical protein
MGFQCCWTVHCMDLFQKLGKEWEGGRGCIVVLHVVVLSSSCVFVVVGIKMSGHSHNLICVFLLLSFVPHTEYHRVRIVQVYQYQCQWLVLHSGRRRVVVQVVQVVQQETGSNKIRKP